MLRATADARQLRLDLGHPLDVVAVTLDGGHAAYAHAGKDLVVREPVPADSRHTLVVRYAGSPRAVAAPTTRSDFDELGWTTTDEGETWTQQEPYGAYSWYAVNDQPSDKALYSFTIRAPAPLVGVANGELVARRTVDGTTVTRWELDRPASSYLVTLAIGDLEETRDESASGVPISYWTPRDDPSWQRPLRRTPAGLAWLERPAGALPVLVAGHPAGRLHQRHGDPDHDHAGAHPLRHLARGARARDGRTSGTATWSARPTGATSG